MKAEPKLIIMMPPLSASALIISSLMLRSQPGVKWRAEECDAMTGAALTPSTCQNAPSDRWLTSIMMPRRFISRTTAVPNSLRPFHCRLSS
jgi:hypothetical protein